MTAVFAAGPQATPALESESMVGALGCYRIRRDRVLEGSTVRIAADEGAVIVSLVAGGRMMLPGDGQRLVLSRHALVLGPTAIRAEAASDSEMLSVIVPPGVLRFGGARVIDAGEHPLAPSFESLLRAALSWTATIAHPGSHHVTAVLHGHLLAFVATDAERSVRTSTSSVRNELMRTRILAYIETVAPDPLIDVEAIALRFGLSRRSVHRVFESASMTVLQALTAARLRRGLAALADRAQADSTIAQIAMVSGFGSSRAFDRAVRSTTGLTPASYRRSRMIVNHRSGVSLAKTGPMTDPSPSRCS